MLASGAAILLSACAPETITKTGHETASLYNIILVMATVVFAGVEIAIIYNAVRYRARKGQDTLPEQIHGNRSIEILWTAIPSVIVLALFVMSMKVLVDVNHEQPAPLTVRVTGFQWQWSFEYFKGPDSAGKISPLGVTVAAGGQFQGMRAREPSHAREILIAGVFDQLRHAPGDRPAPGRLGNGLRKHEHGCVEIDPNKVGMYHGQCAELCGDFHNAMTFNLLAVKPGRFQDWLSTTAKQQKKQGVCSPAGTSLQIAAKNIHFDKSCLAAPAGQAFSVAFDNQDTNVPHNVEIYTDKTATTRLGGATGATDTVTGPATTTYQVSALKAGTYYFQCDVHPSAMFGTFVVK